MTLRIPLATLTLSALLAGGAVAQSSTVRTLELREGWKFHEALRSDWHAASVPGGVHTDLMNNQMIPDPFFGTNEQDLQWVGEKDWVYQTTFDVPGALLQEDSVEIVFKGLDTYASVVLNGVALLEADNMFREWRVPCKSRLKEHNNLLSITFRNVFDKTLPGYLNAPYRLMAYGNNDQAEVKVAMYSRKAQFHFGWDWGPRLITCGVWKPVVIEGWKSARIRGVRIAQDTVNTDVAVIRSIIEVSSSGIQRVSVSVMADGNPLGTKDTLLADGLNTITVTGRIPHPRLWWTNGLGEQYRYAYSATLNGARGAFDEYAARIGVRSLQVVREKDSLGTSMYIRLNGVPVFMKGADYIPQDNFQNRVTAAKYEFMVRSAAEANMNMLRIWGGGIFQDDLFYDLCDKYGVLLWHDLLFACAMYPSDEAFLQSVRAELGDNIRRLRNHPSIALWCGNNEDDVSWYAWGWKPKYPPDIQERYERDMKRLNYEVIPQVLREIDPDRYYHPTSPSAGYGTATPLDGDIHYWGVWHGKEPFENFEKNLGRFVSEYGFQSYPLMSSVEKFAGESDRELHSPVMLSHQRCMSDERKDKEYGNRLIADYMDRMLRKPKDFSSYLFVSQVLQAEGDKMAIEAHRRNMPACMGSLYWQINDCWPVASWSSIDYYGEWKALHYYVKRLYQPVIVSARFEGDDIALSVISDRLTTLPGMLRVQVVCFDGREISSTSLPVTIRANSSTPCGVLKKSALVKGNDESELALVLTLSSDAGTVYETVSYFKAPKDLRLSKPVIQMTSEERNGEYRVSLTTNTLARDVYLTVKGASVVFSDNFFDLLPGKPKVVRITSEGEYRDLQKRLGVMSLVDTYE